MYLDGYSDKDISEVLNRTEASVSSRRCKYLNMTSSKFWTQEENEILVNYYHKMPTEEISVKFLRNKSRNAIVHHANCLGLTGYRNYKHYSKEELQFIKNNYSKLSDAEIGEILNRSKDSIKNHRNKLGCHRQNPNSINYENISKFARGQIWEWKEMSMKACNYKCVVTGMRFDVIHHLVGFNTVIQNVINEYYPTISIDEDINNWDSAERKLLSDRVKLEQRKYPLGVCLSKNIHEAFHNEYGRGDNTIEQFEHFINKNYPNNNFKINIQ